MTLGKIRKRVLDTQAFLALPEAKFLAPIMVAVNDMGMQESLITKLQIQSNKHRSEGKKFTQEELILEQSEIELMVRHEWGMIWEALELLDKVKDEAPTIMAFVNSLPELKQVFELIVPHFKSTKIRRLRNNIAFHFGLNDLNKALETLPPTPGLVLYTEPFNQHWYQLADDAQTHLLTRDILKFVSDQSTQEAALEKSAEHGLLMRTLRINLLTLMLNVIEEFIEPICPSVD